MRIEFTTVYDNFSNEKISKLYVKHFMDKQNKQYKQMIIFSVIIAIIAVALGLITINVLLLFTGPIYFLAAYFIVRRTKNKVLPKNFVEKNGVGCPYNVTFGFYDEYFYEKFENNMVVSENSIRYEFLEKIVETPDCFVLMTKRSVLFYLPKNDMGYENAVAFSEFCKSRLPYIYSFVK